MRTGPVVTSIRSPLHEVRRGIALHYAQHTIEPDQGFADFHVSVERPRSMRRWINQQVVFHFDSTQPFAPLPGDQGFAMLEWGLNWCVSSHCHQYLIIHAAVLERGGRALILPAPSGSGKSTLCAGLVFGGGWRLLSDELALIDMTSGHAVPLPRPVSLKNNSIDVIREFAPSALFGEVVHETVKGRVAHVRPPAEGVLRAGQSAMPGWVVLPRYVAGASALLQPLSRARAFMTLVDNAFNYNVHGRDGFAALADVIDRSGCHEFSYSSLPEAVAVFDQLARTE
ncbi:MAG TPA: HprK-related kinase A [Acidiferrobacterales bacterium]|nr:HprK-related kinase A [Acidiferrobacterales bacterium]